MKSLKEILIPVTFILLLILPTVDSVFQFIPDVKNTENRAFKTIPEFSIPLHDSFPQAFDEYYSDNFDLRNQLLWFNSKLRFHLFNIPPVSGKAFIGRDGWMYLVKKEMDIYLGNNLASEKEINRYYDIFNYRKHLLDSIGCKYYIVIVPIKTSVYPEFLPLAKRKNVKETLTDQLVNLLDTVSGLTLVDLRSVFINAKGGERMYHKTHNHWNDYGAYIAYEEIMNVIAKDFPEVKPYDISNFKIGSKVVNGMGLTRMMGIYDGIYEEKITCTPVFKRVSHEGQKRNYWVLPNFPYKSEYEMVFTTDNDNLPKLLMIRDSFGTTLIPFLSEHFSESVYIFDGWGHRFNENIVLNEKPDIYIQLVLEAFIPNIYQNAKKPILKSE